MLPFLAAGHGSQCPDETGDEDDGLNETIFPCDYRKHGIILDDELNQRMVNQVTDGVSYPPVLKAALQVFPCFPAPP